MIHQDSVVNDDKDSEECYFLQPASSPYDLSQKVKEANIALNEELVDCKSKNPKIKFKDNLVDYEPEFSYEEASSIESEDNIDYSVLHDSHVTLEQQLESTLNLNESENEYEIEEEINNEDLEDEVVDDDINILTDRSEILNFKLDDSKKSTDSSLIELNCTNNINSDSLNKFPVKQSKQSPEKLIYLKNILCNKHCIERIDNLNYNYSNANFNNLLQTQGEIIYLPRLKLQRHTCCEKYKQKIQQQLPCYTGLRSEYGLTAFQLQRKHKIKQSIAMKIREKRRRTQENTFNKKVENEIIFYNWIKSLPARKFMKTYKPQLNKPLSYTVLTSSKNCYKNPGKNGKTYLKTVVNKKKLTSNGAYSNISVKMSS